MELMAVRINCILAFVPITNVGNIYWGKKFHFWDTVSQCWCNNAPKNASLEQVVMRSPILRHNIANCGHEGKVGKIQNIFKFLFLHLVD